MDHEAYENQMIDIVNQKADEKERLNSTPESVASVKRRLFTRADAMALRRGIRRMMLALATAILFALAVFAFVATATAPGYWAVILFLAAIVFTGWTLILLYAQGIIRTESKGESK